MGRIRDAACCPRMFTANPVPYALNQVMLYGAVVGLDEEMSATGVRVCVRVQTQEGEAGFPVQLANRRALELLAFHESHRQMYPHEPFLVSLLGRLALADEELVVVAEAITFLVAPDVRLWGGRLLQSLLGRYVVLYGMPDWLPEAGHAPTPSRASPIPGGANDVHPF